MDKYIECQAVPEYHALLSIQLGQLIQGGNFNWNEAPLNSAFSALDPEDKLRLQNMFNEKFYWREISITPPGQWRQMLIYRIKYELVPKYKPLYAALKAGDINALHTGDEYLKERIVHSDFPETLLGGNNGNEVYASTGEDKEYQKIQLGDGQEILNRYYNTYINIDTAFMRELEIFFTDIYALHENLL